MKRAILIVGLLATLAGCMHAEKSYEDAVINYEEYQEIFNTTQKLNQDLCNMRRVPETDKMFQTFSKAERVNALRTNLDRWINEYNAKSKMLNRSIWKSSTLPYQLSTTDFACYEERNGQ